MKTLPFLVLLFLVACTLEEESVGTLPYTLEGVPRVLQVDESATLRLTSPELDRLEVSHASDGFMLETQRIDDTLQLTLRAEQSVRLGDHDFILNFRAGKRAAQQTLSLTVVSASLALIPETLTLAIGELETATLDASVRGTDTFAYELDAPPLLETSLEEDTLSVRALGLCEACPVTVTAVAEGQRLAEATVEVTVQAPADLDLEVSPRLIDAPAGEAVTATLEVERTGLSGAVSLSADAPDGVEVTLTESTLDSSVPVFIQISADVDDGVYALVFEATNEGAEVTATEELILTVN